MHPLVLYGLELIVLWIAVRYSYNVGFRSGYETGLSYRIKLILANHLEKESKSDESNSDTIN